MNFVLTQVYCHCNALRTPLMRKECLTDLIIIIIIMIIITIVITIIIIIIYLLLQCHDSSATCYRV